MASSGSSPIIQEIAKLFANASGIDEAYAVHTITFGLVFIVVFVGIGIMSVISSLFGSSNKRSGMKNAGQAPSSQGVGVPPSASTSYPSSTSSKGGPDSPSRKKRKKKKKKNKAVNIPEKKEEQKKKPVVSVIDDASDEDDTDDDGDFTMVTSKKYSKQQQKKSNANNNNNNNSSSVTTTKSNKTTNAKKTTKDTDKKSSKNKSVPTKKKDVVVTKETKKKSAPQNPPSEPEDDGWVVAGSANDRKQNQHKKRGNKGKQNNSSKSNSVNGSTDTNGNGGDNKGPHQTTWKVSIEPRKIGVVIGPKGATLHAIQDGTGVSIQMPQRDRDDTSTAPATITLLGPDMSSLKAAKTAINNLCTKGYCRFTVSEDFKEDHMNIHPQYFNEIIGKGGRVIKAIQTNLDVRINIPKTERAWNHQANTEAQKKQRLRVGLAGPKDNVEKCKQILRQIVSVYHAPETHPGVTHQ
eukprot:g415.t1